jgi:hypothetical protein
MPIESADRGTEILRNEYLGWVRDWEGVQDTLEEFAVFESGYIAEVAARRRARSSRDSIRALEGWWGRESYATLSQRLSDVAEQLVPVARSLGLKDRVVYIGAWTDSVLDARTTQTQDGYIILVQIPVLTMSRVAALAFAGSIRRLDPDESPSAPPWGADPYDDAAAAHLLSLGVDAYLLGQPFVVPEGEPFVGMRAVAQEMTTHAAVEFVVAHELAHIAAGHFEDPDTRSLLNVKFGPATESDVIWNMKLEHEADLTAVDLLFRHWSARFPNGHGGASLSAPLLGPLALLGFEALIDHARAQLFDYWGETHPSALLRGGELLVELREKYADGRVNQASRLFDWFLNLREQVFHDLPEEHKPKKES